jgi:hypothetical protein
VQVGCSGLSLLRFEPVEVELIVGTLGEFGDTFTVIGSANKLYGNHMERSEPA